MAFVENSFDSISESFGSFIGDVNITNDDVVVDSRTKILAKFKSFVRIIIPIVINMKNKKLNRLLSRETKNENNFEIENADIEQILELDQLKLLKRMFSQQKRLNPLNINLEMILKNEQKKEGLDKNQFIETFVKFVGPKYEIELEKLFEKLDSKGTGYVTFPDFCNYLLAYYHEKSYTDSLKLLPFNSRPIIRNASHNRLEVTVTILFSDYFSRYVNISRRGAIGIWSKSLVLEKTFRIDQEEYEKALKTNKNVRKKSYIWVTDAIILGNNHKLVIATSGHEIKFFTLSLEHCIEDFIITAMPSVPTCLAYWYDESGKTNKSTLFIGDDTGSIHLLNFNDSADSLFDPVYKPVKGALKILWTGLKFHGNYCTLSVVDTLHRESIRRIKYIQSSGILISSSSDDKASVVISYMDSAREPYVFTMFKGSSCFDYDKELNVLVTGSTDSIIRVWNPYVTSRPITKLLGHKSMIAEVKIHNMFNYLYSLSGDGVIRAWDLKDSTLLQQINIEFPTIMLGKIAAFGPFPMQFYIQNDHKTKLGTLVIACDDYIAYLNIGEVAKKSNINVTSHDAAVSCLAYSSLLKQVITGATDSSITFWNIENGSQILSIKNSHGTEEITSLALDKSQKRVFSAARNGTIKIWNMVNGHHLQNFIGVDDSEVTGLILVDARKIILATGWNRQIVAYKDEPDKMALNIHPQQFGMPGFKHHDDILTADSCDSILATGSYDGEINVWNTDSEKLIACLKKGRVKSQNKKVQKPLKWDEAKKSFIFDDQKQIEKLFFLKNRFFEHGLKPAILISSESGTLYFWSLYAIKKPIGEFYSSNFPNESVHALSTNEDNKILICGDTRGLVYVWDIEAYAMDPSEAELGKPKLPPPCVRSWKCHEEAIVSCEYVKLPGNMPFEEFLLTASIDQCCKLWTMTGKLIGTFGQHNRWNLKNERTFASYDIFDFLNDQQNSNNDTIEETIKSTQKVNETIKGNVKGAVSLPNLIKPKKTTQTSHKKTMKKSNYDYLSRIHYFKLSEDGNEASKQRDADRNERHRTYGEINKRLITTPYVSLTMPPLNDVTEGQKQFIDKKMKITL